MPNRYDSIDQFFAAKQKSLTPEEQKYAQQHFSDPNGAASQEMGYIVGNDASVGVIADTPSAFGTLGSDYRSIFGQTVSEGLSKLTIPFLLFLIASIWVIRLNFYSPRIEKLAYQATLTEIDRNSEIHPLTGQDSLNNNNEKNPLGHNNAPPADNRPQHILKSEFRYKPIDVVKTIPSGIFKEFEVKSLSSIDIDRTEVSLNLKRPVDSLPGLKYLDLNKSGVDNRHQLHWVFNTDTLISKEASNLLAQFQDTYNAINIKKENSSLLETDPDKNKSLNKYSILYLASHGTLSDSLGVVRLAPARWQKGESRISAPYSNTKWQFISDYNGTYYAKPSDKLKIYLYVSTDLPGIVASQKTPEPSSLASIFARYLKTNLYIPQGACLELIANSILETEYQSSTFYRNNIVKNCYKARFAVTETQKPAVALPSGALLYRIGEQDSWKIFCPESTRAIHADRTGYLEFQINGNSLSDHTGYYRMEVRVDKKD